MNQEPENFEPLQRLLKLKRHEVPPPGYFNRFSGEVMSQIRDGNHADTAPTALTWLQNLWSSLERKPALAGAFGVAVCGLLVAGVLYSAKMDAPDVSSAVANNNSFVPMPGDSSAIAFNQPGNQTALGSSTSPLVASPQTSGSLFEQFKIQQQGESASFKFGGN